MNQVVKAGRQPFGQIILFSSIACIQLSWRKMIFIIRELFWIQMIWWELRWPKWKETSEAINTQTTTYWIKRWKWKRTGRLILYTTKLSSFKFLCIEQSQKIYSHTFWNAARQLRSVSFTQDSWPYEHSYEADNWHFPYADGRQIKETWMEKLNGCRFFHRGHEGSLQGRAQTFWGAFALKLKTDRIRWLPSATLLVGWKCILCWRKRVQEQS